MKHFTHVALQIYIVIFTGLTMYGQLSIIPQGGAIHPNPDGVPCLTPEDYNLYQVIISQNIAQLDAQNKRAFNVNRATQQVLFDWPIAQADGFDYNSTWAISNYVDHNVSFPNQIEDWDCGTRSYDTNGGYNHQGIDIYTWPFWWKQMDDEQSQIIAAQAGQIVYKNDGSFDRNCQFNNDQWNAIYVEHSDGSIAWYGHMKEGSLSSKNVGDMVETGEYLGSIGSSGNSTGPHLHMEVYDAENNLIDPYAGACNDLNASSWWSEQKSYYEPKINTVLTHNAPPEFNFNGCGVTEDPNQSNQFAPGDDVIVAAYYRDQQDDTSVTYNVKDSNGDIVAEWTQEFTSTLSSSYWYYTITTTTTEGVWEFNATYEGDTVTRNFNVGQLSVSDEALIQLEAYPNPTRNQLNIEAAVPLKSIILHDISGRVLSQKQGMNDIKATLDLSSYATGVYFISATALDKEARVTIRVIKQ